MIVEVDQMYRTTQLKSPRSTKIFKCNCGHKPLFTKRSEAI